MIKFLDCTLRDGGYYNNWDFDPKNAARLVTALNRAGVDIIEIGYKSPVAKNKYYGLFKNCNENYLGFLNKNDHSEYAFMVDVKEFLIDDRELNLVELDACIKPAMDSVFTWVRLATHYASLETIPAMAKYFRDKGYKVGYNLMGGSLLSLDQIRHGCVVAAKADVDVFYLADSFGSFYPEDTRTLIRFLKAEYSGKIGIHTHDNQGMAFANTLVAIEEGVDFVDATVTGMGRGAGNLLTEQFLLGYSERTPGTPYKPAELLSVISDYIAPLKAHYNWGFNYTYMYSGLKNIHPTYCQNLGESNRYTTKELGNILASIPESNRSKFDVAVMNKAVSKVLSAELDSSLKKDSEQFDLKNLRGDKVIIVARGNAAAGNMEAILNLSDRLDIPIMECNPTGAFPPAHEHYLLILNQRRLEDWLFEKHENTNVRLITGLPYNGNAAEDVSYYPFEIGSFETSGSILRIPDYDAGIYAIALAVKAGIKEIYLAGFDGFDDESLNRSKDAIFKQIQELLPKDVRVSFVTKSKYTSFTHSSVYTL